jgi:hypothetical protein
MRWTSVAICLASAGTAVADPTADPTVTASDPLPLFSTQPALRRPTFDRPPSAPVPSLRLEAVRVAGERWANDWRYPEPGPIIGFDGGLWYVGTGYYRPRSARAAALHGASVTATILGEILLAADSPLAGVGALLTGATLDAANADADRDAEAARPSTR